MRTPSSKMIGLLLTAALLTPIAAQAQEQGRDRGGSQRGGGGGENRGGGGENRGGGWQRGGGEARPGTDFRAGGGERNRGGNPEMRQQARESVRAVERPAPVAPAPRAEITNNAGRRDWNRGNDNRPDLTQPRPDRQRAATEGNRDRADRNARWDRNGDGRPDRSANGDRNGDNRQDRGRNWDRNGDGRPDRNANWDRDRDGRNDGNRRWTNDRRDWNGRDWDRRNDRWDRDWRNDQRFGWQSYRNSNRGHYRLPAYQARHGYSYRRWYTGYRFDPWYYSAGFWINDPSSYRLPPAYGPYRWVRYYDDVVLVDTRTGEIVDIIYDFFF